MSIDMDNYTRLCAVACLQMYFLDELARDRRLKGGKLFQVLGYFERAVETYKASLPRTSERECATNSKLEERCYAALAAYRKAKGGGDE